MQGKTYYVDYDKAIEFVWTGEYDPMAPDAHVKLLDSTFEPVPYTVTSNVQCSGLENTDFCTWTYVVTPTLYEGD